MSTQIRNKTLNAENAGMTFSNAINGYEVIAGKFEIERDMLDVPSMTDMREKLESLGERFSLASYESLEKISVFSVRDIRGTMGHPAVVIDYNKTTGWLTIGESKNSPKKSVRIHACFCG